MNHHIEILSPQESFLFKWRIENFHKCYQEKIVSSLVASIRLSNTEWKLELFLRNKEENSNEYIYCYLACLNGSLLNFRTYFKLFVNSEEIKGEHQYEMLITKQKCGFPKLISSLKHGDLLEIECYIRSSIFLRMPTHPLNRKASDNIEQICIKSQILEEKRSLICPIEDFDLQNNEKIPLPKLKFFNSAYDLTTKLHLKISEDAITTYLEAEFFLERHFVTEIRKLPIFVFVTMNILDSDGKLDNKVEYEHLFNKEIEVNEVWSFAYPFKKDNIKVNKNMQYITLEISVTNFKILNDVFYQSESVHLKRGHQKKCESSAIQHYSNNFSKKILRSFQEKKFCDVTLHTIEKSFDCHKLILCSMSPVFEAMFDSGMRECYTNTVQVEDLNGSTISQLLHFIYTRKVQNLEFQKAINLYTAADKYQIDTLKLVCRDFLNKNLNHENVCEILFFANSRNEGKLKQSAVKYISNYKDEILCSSQWKELVDKDILLAYEIIKNFVYIRS